jgi:hypothetical protein
VEFEIGANLAGLLVTAPWATIIALIVWPEKGVVALWIKRSQAVKIAELERDKTKNVVVVEAEKGNVQGQLPAPIGEEE